MSSIPAAVSSSREWEIDREINALIGKMVHNTITSTEQVELYYLQRERVERMKPAIFRREHRHAR